VLVTATDLTAVDDPDVVGDLRAWPDVDLPGLDRRAEILVWLPPAYEGGAERYPVIYLHDGHNVFLRSRAFADATWQVGETMTALSAAGCDAIVVAVPCHGELRHEEYTQYPHFEHGGGRAADYASFIVDHLKPAVDSALRTLPGPEHTMVAGSSLGGVVSAYLWERHPEVFGGAGLFSPAFWWAGEQALLDLEEAAGRDRVAPRVYLDMGGHEEPDEPEIERAYVEDAERLLGSLRRTAVPVRYVFDSAAYHSETAWAERFGSAAAWLLQGYAVAPPPAPPA
jgi:predicted alpha/beta superfamily hydrolase